MNLNFSNTLFYDFKLTLKIIMQTLLKLYEKKTKLNYIN